MKNKNMISCIAVIGAILGSKLVLLMFPGAFGSLAGSGRQVHAMGALQIAFIGTLAAYVPVAVIWALTGEKNRFIPLIVAISIPVGYGLGSAIVLLVLTALHLKLGVGRSDYAVRAAYFFLKAGYVIGAFAGARLSLLVEGQKPKSKRTRWFLAIMGLVSLLLPLCFTVAL